MKVLLLGEGNLTFAYSLIKKLSKSHQFERQRDGVPDHGLVVVVTTLDTKEELEEKYPEVIPIFEYFDSKSRIAIEYQGGVDATNVHEQFSQEFNVVYFNNPHVGTENFLLQRALLSHSFDAVGKLPMNCNMPQEFVLSLCDDQPLRWHLLQAAARNGYVCVVAVPFITEEFKEYENKRHQNDSKFPFRIMIHFYFMREEVGGPFLPALKPFVRTVGDGASQEWFRVCEACSSNSEPSTITGVKQEEDLRPFFTSFKAIDTVAKTMKNFQALMSVSVPLLHPLLAYYATPLPTGKEPSEVEKKKPQTYFSPYINPSQLPSLLQLQEELLSKDDRDKRDSCDTPLPPHFDEKVLGRPLTDRERKKYLRYLEKYAQAEKPPTLSYTSTFVEPELPTGDNKSHYCKPCDIFFLSEVQFMEHLEKLCPAGDAFACTLCTPHQYFNNNRALLQHTKHKHS